RTVSVLEVGSVQIRLAIANTDPTRSDAERVVLRDNVPSGLTFERGSASVDGALRTCWERIPCRWISARCPIMKHGWLYTHLKCRPRLHEVAEEVQQSTA